jgi:hypothetical protein
MFIVIIVVVACGFEGCPGPFYNSRIFPWTPIGGIAELWTLCRAAGAAGKIPGVKLSGSIHVPASPRLHMMQFPLKRLDISTCGGF